MTGGIVRHRLGAEELLELGRAGNGTVIGRLPFLDGRARPRMPELAQAERPQEGAYLFVLAIVAVIAFGAALA